MKKKVVMVMPHMVGGGAERVAAQIMNKLNERGYDTRFILTSAKKNEVVRSDLNEKTQLILLTEEMKAAVGTYKGLYTKMVCSEDKEEKEFTLELKDDGTGVHKRDDLEIKIPEWSVEGGEVKLTEKFLGKIEYTGKLDGKNLSLFNGDPEAPMTYEYVYEKI